jgi:hypothetical protein
MYKSGGLTSKISRNEEMKDAVSDDTSKEVRVFIGCPH